MPITDLSLEPARTVTKSSQTGSKRSKLTRKQRSELSPKEDKRLKERSNGVCEKCDRQRATERAHIERRWKSEDKPIAEEFAHLCILCHRFCDSCHEGRKWLREFGESLINNVPNYK